MFFKKQNKPVAPDLETFKLGSRYYYARLSPSDKTYYRAIYDQWLTGSTEAHLVMPGTGFETPDGTPFLDLVLAVVEDNPHLFHVERTHFQYKRMGKQVHITSNNIYTQAEFLATYEKLKKRVGQILAAARKYKTKAEQIRFLHDYLAASITYDYCDSNPRTAREAHTIAGALLNRRCVCDGYARAFRLLCDRLGISCIVVIGDGPIDATPECHAWNIVKLEQVPYHVDVTWDSNHTQGRLVKDFEFMLGDDSAARRHAWDRNKYPRCPRDLARREPILPTTPALEAELVRHLKAKHKNFLLRVAGPLRTPSVFTAELNKLLKKHSALHPKNGYYNYYTYQKYDYVEFEYVPKS